MTQRYVIGVDGGTESVRAGVFDLAGTPLAFASEKYDTVFPRPGWAEQQPDDWWNALCRAVRNALAQSKVRGDQIAGLAVDTTCCTVVALDEQGNALRPALLWMDVRSQEQAERVLATRDPALRVNSDGRGPVSAEWMLPKAAWLKQNEARVFAAATTICEYQDFINLRLTGRRVASLNNASVRWHYRSRAGGIPSTLLQAADLEELAQKWPQTFVRAGDLIGPLQPSAAQALGLPQSTPVVQGGADAFVAMVGLGVVRGGEMALVTGSSHLQLALSEQPFHGPGVWGTYSDAVIPGLHVVEGGQTSTGSVVNWLRSLLGAASYDVLDREAGEIAPGSEGVLVQEHFQGNRTPYTDPLSRGAITGLTLRHGRGHLLRAVLESVAYGSRLIIETMRRNGCGIQGMTLCGGVAKSSLWLQIHADVLGVPLRLTQTPEAACLGSAILAASGAGCFGSIGEGAGAMSHIVRVVEPDLRMHAAYGEHYERYVSLYPALKNIARVV